MLSEEYYRRVSRTGGTDPIASCTLRLVFYTVKKQKDHLLKDSLFALLTWQRLTFPGPCGPSIISPGGLNFRVRDTK